MSQQANLPNMLISRLTTHAILIAQRAGDLLSKIPEKGFDIQTKDGKHNLVTEYDNAIEDLIISYLSQVFPDHRFLGEESGLSSENAGAITWIIDPIDGTVNFAHRIPVFTISIAATFDNQVLTGVVFDPLRHELFVAEKNQGAFLNGKKLSVSKKRLLSESVLGTGFPYNVSENPLNCLEDFVTFSKMGLPIRRLGSAALDLAYVAAGRFDGFWEVSLKPWDFAAGKLLIEEAGGMITNYSNEAIESFEESSIVASNSNIHSQILSHLSCNQNAKK